jgi:hypothetical protein
MRLPRMSHAFPLTLSALFVGMSTTGAHAYLDPGTGSMILQLLLGGIAGLAIAGRLYWHKFLSLFGLSKPARDVKAETVAQSKARADR